MIKSEAWKLLFDHVMDPIVKHIHKLLNEPKLMRNCKYLCLVGGLSTSPYFQSILRDTFGPKSKYKLTLIIPQRPILCVVEGAAYFGITKNYIKSRILRYTYGIILSQTEEKAKKRGISEEYIAKNRYYNDRRRKWMVKNCFVSLAHRNEEIQSGQVKTQRSIRPNALTKLTTPSIMMSEMENPLIISDGKELGSFNTTYDENDKADEESTTEFHFYDTLIKIVEYKTRKPNDKQVGYIQGGEIEKI